MKQLSLWMPDQPSASDDAHDAAAVRAKELAHWRSVEARYTPLMALSDFEIETTAKKDLAAIAESLGFDFAKHYPLATLRKWLADLKRSHARARLEWADLIDP